MADPPGKILYYGDNLDVLRRHVKDESVDLVYLDPPFNSNADYNVLFGHAGGTHAAAQIKAFDDTWHWDTLASAVFQETVIAGGEVAQALTAFQTLLGPSTMLAYNHGPIQPPSKGATETMQGGWDHTRRLPRPAPHVRQHPDQPGPRRDLRRRPDGP
jgi:hypothetical protein